MLLESCCKCGFVHKDDRIKVDSKSYRAYKPHYHWLPEGGELKHGELILHATICVGCCGDLVNWNEFFEQKKATPEKYRVGGSLNAPLPRHLESWASQLYANQAKWFQFD
jgi:hypothetical protein